MSKWKRPDSVPFPNVWHRFEGKKEINGVLPKFWVQDIPEDKFEAAMDFLYEPFFKDEPMNRYSKAFDDPLAREDILKIWRQSLKARLGLVCFMENPDPKGEPIMVGVNITELCRKDDVRPEISSQTIRNIIDALNEVYKEKDPYEILGITEYLGAMGLTVKPELRGQGIGLEILKARIPLCKAVGLKASVTTFSSIASQKVAERCGFKTLAEVSYAELAKRNPNLRFENIEEHTKSIKNMYLLID